MSKKNFDFAELLEFQVKKVTRRGIISRGD